MDTPDAPPTIPADVSEALDRLAPMDQVRVTLNDGAVIEGEVYSAQGKHLYVTDQANELLVLSPEISQDVYRIRGIEVVRLAHLVFAEREAKKFGEWVVNANPQTREQIKEALLTLGRAIGEHSNQKPPGYGPVSMAHQRRSFQLHAQFDYLADRVELAKTKRNYIMRYTPPRGADGRFGPFTEGRTAFNPVGIVDVLQMSVPKDTDFDPDVKVRHARSPRPALDYHTRDSIEQSLKNARDQLKGFRKPSRKKREKLEAIVAMREGELADGLYYEAILAKEQVGTAALAPASEGETAEFVPAANASLMDLINAPRPEAGDWVAWRDRLLRVLRVNKIFMSDNTEKIIAYTTGAFSVADDDHARSYGPDESLTEYHGIYKGRAVILRLTFEELERFGDQSVHVIDSDTPYPLIFSALIEHLIFRGLLDASEVNPPCFMPNSTKPYRNRFPIPAPLNEGQFIAIEIEGIVHLDVPDPSQQPFFGVSGVLPDGMVEHVADRVGLDSALQLASRLGAQVQAVEVVPVDGLLDTSLKLTDIEGAKRFLCSLAKSPMAYHIDDDPADACSFQGHGNATLPAFSTEVATKLRERVEECFTILGYSTAWEFYNPAQPEFIDAEESLPSSSESSRRAK